MDFESQARDKGTVIKFKNIDNEDFTHTYDGYPWTVKAGETMYFPAGHARLFAKHLAQKILMKVKKSSAEGRMDGAVLFKEEDMNSLKGKILVESMDLPSSEKTPQEVHRERVMEINQSLKANEITQESSEMSKAQVIAKLQERGDKVIPTKSKAELLEQLNGGAK